MPLIFKTKKHKCYILKIIRVEKRPQHSGFGIVEFRYCFKIKGLIFNNPFVYLLKLNVIIF